MSSSFSTGPRSMSFFWTVVLLVAVLALSWRFLGSYMEAVPSEVDGVARATDLPVTPNAP